MAKNYMHDIAPKPDDFEDTEPEPERSIRDFRPSAARVRLQKPLRVAETTIDYEDHAPPRRRSRIGVWVAAFISLTVLCAAAALVVFPRTTITIVPRTHVMPFDASNPLTAYPSAGAATGTISYSSVTHVFEDSAVVQARGTERAEEKAMGTVTVYNSYSDQPVRLIKNTRFQSPTGLIFRIPASVDVPGRKGVTPGSIAITVFADQTGPQYNIGPTDKFTLPGLKSTPDMYAGLYGKSSAAFTGGFSGDRPAVSPSVLEASKAEVRGRLNEKAQQLSRTAPELSLAFPGLLAISYETLPPTNEQDGVRIHERATVIMPVFSAETFAQSVAKAVSADAEGQSVRIQFSNDIVAQPVGEMNAADIGKETITFTLTGRGQLIWQVNETALSEALAGREEAAFETIIKGFPAIEEARARITPLWKHAFPQEPSKIKVTVEDVPAQF